MSLNAFSYGGSYIIIYLTDTKIYCVEFRWCLFPRYQVIDRKAVEATYPVKIMKALDELGIQPSSYVEQK